MRWLIALIKKFEGCKLIAYLCPANVWTVGWGSTGPDVKAGTVWTQEKADERLQSDAVVYWMASVKLSPNLAYSETKHAAIADFCYNLGVGRYKASTLRKRINEGDWEGAVDELQKWVYGGGRKLPGLIARRKAEGVVLMMEEK